MTTKECIQVLKALKADKIGNYKLVNSFYRSATPSQLRMWVKEVTR